MNPTTAAAPNHLDLLADQLRGDLIRPGDPTYDEFRAVYNGMIDRHPAAIAVCADPDDVVSCVNHAREHDLPLAVRSGGHSGPGHGVADGALVIDLRRLHEVTVDPDLGTVQVGAGCTWQDVDAVTVQHGLVVPSGINSTTGVAGLTLGGGTGYHTRLLGLTADSLLSAEVVLADGRRVTASADSEPDLFWALRGGGGNFGVVTSFEFRGHPVGEHGTVFAGPVFYDLEETADLFRWYRSRQPELPRDLERGSAWRRYRASNLSRPNSGAATSACSCGATTDRTTGRKRPLRPPGSSATHCCTAWRRSRSRLSTRCSTISTHRDFSGIGAETSSTRSPTTPSPHISSSAATLRPPLCTMHLYPVDGAAADPEVGDTAFAYRETRGAGSSSAWARTASRPGGHGVDEGVLGGSPPHVRRRRVRQLPDGRGRGSHPGVVPRELPACSRSRRPMTRATSSA